MKKRIAKVLCAAVLGGSLAVTAFPSVAMAAEKDGGFKVAYITRNQSDPFAAELVNQFTKQAEDYADTFTLDTFDSQADSEKENSIIEDCITKKYDCIIVQPNDGNLQQPYCQKVLDAGIFCITTNAAIRELEGGSWVDGDPYAQGEAIAKLAAEAVPEGGTVGILNCMPGNFHTTSRYNAIKDEFIDKRDDVKIIGDYMEEEATEAAAMATMEDWATSYGRIDCMLTTADLLGNGAYEAVKDDDTYDGMLVYSVDCLAKTVLEIKDGVYTAAVYQNPPALAAANLKAAYDLLTGAETVVNTSVDSLLCTSDNVDQFIQMYIDQGQITEDEAKSHGYEAGSAKSILDEQSDDSESEETTEESTDNSAEDAEEESE